MGSGAVARLRPRHAARQDGARARLDRHQEIGGVAREQRRPPTDRRAVGVDAVDARAMGKSIPRLKVLLLTWDFPTGKGGIQIWMHELARRLPDAEVRVLAPTASGDHAFDDAADLHVRRLGGSRWGRGAWLADLTLRTLASCITWRPDLIVCGHVITAPAALVARILTRIPYVVFTHAYEIRRRRTRRFYGYLLRHARFVISNSAFTQAVVHELGVPSGRIRLLHPGVDAERYSPATSHSPQLTNHRPPTLLSVSRLADMYK